LSGDLPPLLFQYTCTQQGYEIFLTDLTYIWTEQLFYKDIVKRAEEEAATIDPGEDPEQLKVLLEKIGEALQKGQESIVLSSGTQTDSLKLTTTTKLPAPLKPLKWPLKLSKEPLSAVTTRLLIPMLEEEAERESRQRSLLSQIKQKDYVLGKLFDKIESLGAELGSVFPSAAGSRTSRKGNTRSEAGKFVKGIAPFDEEAWLAEVRSSDGSGLGSNIFQEISESGKLENLENINQQGEWWCRLRRHPQTHTRKAIPLEAEEVATSPKKQAIIAQLQHQDEEGESMADSDHDEFEVCQISTLGRTLNSMINLLYSDKKHLLISSVNMPEKQLPRQDQKLKRRVHLQHVHQRQTKLQHQIPTLDLSLNLPLHLAIAVFQEFHLSLSLLHQLHFHLRSVKLRSQKAGWV
jgi:hypothetical protein